VLMPRTGWASATAASRWSFDPGDGSCGGEHIWGWVRAEVTANTCFGTKVKVREHVGAFFRRSGRSD
jgi:hypothetical protein